MTDKHETFDAFLTRMGKEEAKQQVGGDHYQTAIQPLDFIMANNLGFIEGNVIKYVVRHERKNGKQDLEKAIDYLNKLIAFRYGGDNN